MKNRFFAPIALGAALMVWSCQDAASPDMTQDELTPLMLMSGAPLPVGGPMFLSGDDADDGGHCQGTACGALYPTAMSFVYNNSATSGTKIAVIGANFSNALTAFNSWNSVPNGGPGAPVDFLTTTSSPSIASADLSSSGPYRMIYIASVSFHVFGGMTTTQLAALNARQASIVNFVNVLGGGVMALTEANVSIQYGWLPLSLTTANKAHFGPNILPTPAMATISPVTSAQLNHGCCYHTLYVGPPGFSGLQVLAFHDDNLNGVFDGQGSSDEVLILGGAQVTIQGNISLSPLTSTNPTGTNHTVTASAQDGSPLAPAVGVTVAFSVTGQNPQTGTATTDGSGNAGFTYTGLGGPGTDNIVATFTDAAGNLQTSNTVQKIWVNAPPTADAGPDQVVDLEGAATAAVTLDGSGSSDPDPGDVISFEWSTAALLVPATGESPIVSLPVGEHTIILTVTDNDGASDTDEVIITVRFVIPDGGGSAPLEENGKKVGEVTVPADAFDEDVVLEFEFVDVDACHEFLLSQYGRCLSAEFTSVLTGQPLTPKALLTYQMCLPFDLPPALTDPLFIFEFDTPTSNVIPREDFPDDLDCSEFVAAEPGNGLMRFARGLVDRVTGFFAPEPLFAAPAVFRGNVGVAFEGLASFFVWARPIDIKPNSDPSSWNCNNPEGTIPVAVLSTRNGDGTVLFDATTINANTVFFGPTAGRGDDDNAAPGAVAEAQEIHRNKKTGDARRHVEDVNNDGDQDMVFHFRFGDTGLTCDNTFAKLGGSTTGGQFESADFIRMVEGGKGKNK